MPECCCNVNKSRKNHFCDSKALIGIIFFQNTPYIVVSCSSTNAGFSLLAFNN